MTVPASGPIKLSKIGSSFGRSGKIKMSEMYRDGSYVKGYSRLLDVPTSGRLKFSNFAGKGDVTVNRVLTLARPRFEWNLPTTNFNADPTNIGPETYMMVLFTASGDKIGSFFSIPASSYQFKNRNTGATISPSYFGSYNIWDIGLDATRLHYGLFKTGENTEFSFAAQQYSHDIIAMDHGNMFIILQIDNINNTGPALARTETEPVQYDPLFQNFTQTRPTGGVSILLKGGGDSADNITGGYDYRMLAQGRYSSIKSHMAYALHTPGQTRNITSTGAPSIMVSFPF